MMRTVVNNTIRMILTSEHNQEYRLERFHSAISTHHLTIKTLLMKTRTLFISSRTQWGTLPLSRLHFVNLCHRARGVEAIMNDAPPVSPWLLSIDKTPQILDLYLHLDYFHCSIHAFILYMYNFNRKNEASLESDSSVSLYATLNVSCSSIDGHTVSVLIRHLGSLLRLMKAPDLYSSLFQSQLIVSPALISLFGELTGLLNACFCLSGSIPLNRQLQTFMLQDPLVSATHFWTVQFASNHNYTECAYRASVRCSLESVRNQSEFAFCPSSPVVAENHPTAALNKKFTVFTPTLYTRRNSRSSPASIYHLIPMERC